MNATRILRILLVIEIAVLIGFTVASFRDYQDTWILEGLEIPFAILGVTYVGYVFAEKDVKRLLVFSLLFRLAWLVLPQIKYVWFQGVAVDQGLHYRLAEDIHDTGFIVGGKQYSGTPLMHVFFATFSLITGASVVGSFKFLPILWWGTYPLFIYLLLKKSKLGKDHPTILKYAVVIACIPARTTLSFVVVSALFGAFLVFLLLYHLIGILQTNAVQDWLLAIIVGAVLVSSHSYSSTTLLFVLTPIFLVSTFIIKRFRFRYLKVTLVVFLAVLNIAWLLYQAPVLYGSAQEVISAFLKTIQGVYAGPSTGTGFTSRLFDLDVVNVSKTLAVFHGADLFLAFLMMLGILFMIKRLRSSTLFRFASLYMLFAWTLYFVQLFFGRGITGVVTYTRMFEHTLTLSPILASVTLYYLQKKTRSLIPVIATVSLLMVLASVELYGCQPLIPSSNTVSELLPANESVVYVGMVNSIYQRSLIRHAEKYIETGFIASDKVTTHQSVGLTSYNFSETHISFYYPFEWMIDNTTKRREYDYFLIHFVGNGGVLQESAEIRTASLIETAIYSSSVTYNNGESYMLQKPFMYEPS